MALTAVVWNIEEFGNRFGTSSQKKLIENLRALLIDDLLQAVSADVLVIQELRKDGVAYLKQLRAGLSSWHFDWLPGAQVVSGTLTSYEQLGFVQTANNEGYGVFWRDGALDALPGAMSAGQDTVDPGKGSKKRPSYISLAAEGKKLKFDQQSLAPICFDTTSGLASMGFPHSVCPQAVNNTITTRSGESYGSDAAIQQELGSRRPCRVQLRVSSTRTVPLVVYHAPVGQQASRSPIYGTLIGCSVDALQFASPALADCVYAGDFNVVSNTDQATLTKYLPTLGYAAPAFNRSMVHVFKDGSFRTGTGVFGSARDLVFVKAPTGRAPTAAVRDVLAQDLTNPSGGMRRRLQINPTSTTLSSTVFGALVTEKRWTQDEADVANAFLASAKQFPHGADAYTAAAIMYTTFVSDHLPIVITYA
jgi:hypothetical protein